MIREVEFTGTLLIDTPGDDFVDETVLLSKANDILADAVVSLPPGVEIDEWTTTGNIRLVDH